MAIPFLTKIFGSRNDRLLKQYRKTVERINALEAGLEGLSDEALRAKTESFKQRVASGETLDALLPEAFAVVREGSKRVMKMRHFDVQLVGGIALHNGKIAEMRTGEGKTLTSTLPAYLNALAGQGVHVVTVNDYAASLLVIGLDGASRKAVGNTLIASHVSAHKASTLSSPRARPCKPQAQASQATHSSVASRALAPSMPVCWPSTHSNQMTVANMGNAMAWRKVTIQAPGRGNARAMPGHQLAAR